MNKIVVAHAGKQHSFKTAEFAKKGGYELTYITTVYSKKKSLTNILRNFLGKNNSDRASGRRTEELDDSQVIQFYELYGLISLLLMRIDKSRKIYISFNNFLYKKFSEKVAKYCLENNIKLLIMYDGQAADGFRMLNKSDIIKVLDMSAASLPYMKAIYEKDMNLNPKYANNLKKFSDFIFDEENQKKAVEEIQLSDYILVPSNFSKNSLANIDNSDSKAIICRYGFEHNRQATFNNKSEVINLVYIGSVNQRKGISYLLESVDYIIKKFPNKKINLQIVGNYDKNESIFNEYIHKFDFLGTVSHTEVLKILSKSDLMIFPSLSDSYAFSVLESLSLGVPVICSDNTGASDLIVDGFNGFIFETLNKDDLIKKLEITLTEPGLLNELKSNTSSSFECMSWKNYGTTLNKFLRQVLNE